MTAGLALLLATTSPAQVSYRVLQGDKQIGEARISQRLLQDGGKYIELVVILDAGGHSHEIRSRSTLNRQGEPVRELLDLTQEGQPPVKQVIATFDADGADVVVKTKGVPSTQHVSATPGDSRSASYEFWFLRDQPKAGDHCRALTFNLDALKWVATDVTYLGPVEGGFLVKMDQDGRHTETVFDRTGLPVSITDSRGERIVRETQGKDAPR